MKRVLKGAGYGLAGVVLLVLIAAGGAFAASEVMIRWPVDRPKAQMAAFTRAGDAVRGQRVAMLNGCHDCHGDRLEGRLFHDEMPIIRAWGPNLTLVAASQSDAQLDGAIRHGVAGDGRRLWMMPSAAFSRLSDQETADLIAYVRTFPKTGEEQPRFQVGHVGRLGVLLGKFKSEADALRDDGAVGLADAGPQYAHGRSLARACIECHGPALEGMEMMKSPDLSIAASYDSEDFAKLMHTGMAAGDRQVGLMTSASKTRFSHFTPQEVADLHAYLKARANREFASAAGVP